MTTQSTNPTAAVNSANTRAAVIAAVGVYCEAMSADYAKWAQESFGTGYGANRRMIFDLDMGGKKFLRIWARHADDNGGRSSHSFIVLEDCTVKTIKKTDLVLKAGDILKCASWKAPALNFVRGNVLTKNYGACKWTGAA